MRPDGCLTLRWQRFLRLAIGGLVVTCDRGSQSVGRLVIVPGARDVRGTSDHEREELQYRVDEEFPAKKALEAIRSDLRRRGWQPAEVDFLNPDTPTSHRRGWGSYVDATVTPEERVDAWLGDWTNSAGDVVRYALEYRRAVGEQRPVTVDVVALYWSAKLVALVKSDIAKRPVLEDPGPRQSVPPASPALIVLEGATNIVHRPVPHEAVTYHVAEPYPAPRALGAIRTRLAALGWSPRDESFLNPGQINSHRAGWARIDRSRIEPGLHRREWRADWTNASDEIVTYAFMYSHPAAEAPGTDLRIEAYYRKKAEADAERARLEAEDAP